jgi:hypothetical protein
MYGPKGPDFLSIRFSIEGAKGETTPTVPSLTLADSTYVTRVMVSYVVPSGQPRNCVFLSLLMDLQSANRDPSFLEPL